MPHFWGDGNQRLQWTTEKVAVEFGIEAITIANAKEGDILCLLCCEQNEGYCESIRGVEIGIKEELERTALKARAEGGKTRFWEYIGYFYSLVILKGGQMTLQGWIWRSFRTLEGRL